jgi:hypothetical protein
MVFGTVVRTFVCALFGAIFGYILGFMIELFPGFNTALLSGLNALTGMSNVSMPALLAALGLIAGTILGILISIIIYYAWTGRHAKWMRRRARELDHSFGHGRPYFRRYRHYSGDMYGPWKDPIEDSLSEIDGYVSYLEDLPKDRLEACDERIGRLNERLSRLKASMDQDRSG